MGNKRTYDAIPPKYGKSKTAKRIISKQETGEDCYTTVLYFENGNMKIETFVTESIEKGVELAKKYIYSEFDKDYHFKETTGSATCPFC
ncbi:MAG TPA: hypothetical protein PKH10_03990 [bacterium]|nr:hypothetical protein [bacterium]